MYIWKQQTKKERKGKEKASEPKKRQNNEQKKGTKEKSVMRYKKIKTKSTSINLIANIIRYYNICII